MISTPCPVADCLATLLGDGFIVGAPALVPAGAPLTQATSRRGANRWRKREFLV